MYINSYGQVASDDYLAHHGILGQKWGQRNGPPYPLDANAHSAAEKRLKGKNDGKLESWKKKRREKREQKQQSISKRKGRSLQKIDKAMKLSIKDIRKTTKSIATERKLASVAGLASGLFMSALLTGGAATPLAMKGASIASAVLAGMGVGAGLNAERRSRELRSNPTYQSIQSLINEVQRKYGYPKNKAQATTPRVLVHH